MPSSCLKVWSGLKKVAEGRLTVAGPVKPNRVLQLRNGVVMGLPEQGSKIPQSARRHLLGKSLECRHISFSSLNYPA